MATTKTKVKKKTKELIKELKPHLEKCVENLLNSGAIDFKEEEDNYSLPKDIMCALAHEIEWLYRQPYPKKGYKKRIRNFYAMM
jgi:hypothetical protein